jgi:hypothetical protein
MMVFFYNKTFESNWDDDDDDNDNDSDRQQMQADVNNLSDDFGSEEGHEFITDLTTQKTITIQKMTPVPCIQ